MQRESPQEMLVIDLVDNEITFSTSNPWLAEKIRTSLKDRKIDNVQIEHSSYIQTNASVYKFQSVNEIYDIIMEISATFENDHSFFKEPAISYRFGTDKPTLNSPGNADQVTNAIAAKIKESNEAKIGLNSDSNKSRKP